LNNR
jgi:hypothetical protein